MPQVSVVLAAYNHEGYVQETIHSILSQDFDDFELIVADDGSSDRTVDRISQIKDRRIQLFCFERNRGASVVHNHCIRQARGEYIAMINSDDVFCPGKLSRQVDFLDKHPRVGAVFALPVIIDESGREGKGKYYDRIRNMFTEHLWENGSRTRYEWLNFFFHKGNCLCHPTTVIRKECHDRIGLYDERYAQLPDFDFWIRLCLQYEIHVLPEYLVKFRVFSDMRNASGSTPEKVVRRHWEYRRILGHFLSIRDRDTLLRIFPEAGRYGDGYEDSLIPFVIADLALHLSRGHVFVQDFALDAIGTLLSDRTTAEQLERRFGFTYIDLIRMTGTYNIYGPRRRRTMKHRILRSLFGPR